MYFIFFTHNRIKKKKPENILINGGDCKLKITDFGLARGVLKDDQNSQQKLTEYVVTRWYRAPEVMCSSRIYDEGVDVWSVGCIMAELYLRKPFFPGNNHIEQLKLIFHYIGTPVNLEWIKTPDAKRWVAGIEKKPRQDFSKLFPQSSPSGRDLISKMLSINPNNRIGVNNALKHEWLSDLYKGVILKQAKNGINAQMIDICPKKFDLSFEFEKSIKTIFGVRHLMYEELNNFHKNRFAKIQQKRAKLKLQQQQKKQKQQKKQNGYHHHNNSNGHTTTNTNNNSNSTKNYPIKN